MGKYFNEKAVVMMTKKTHANLAQTTKSPVSEYGGKH